MRARTSCKPRACSQTKKETHCCGISPTRAGKKEKVRTAIESVKEEAESKRQVPASSRFEHGRRGPKKGVGDPALFYCRIELSSCDPTLRDRAGKTGAKLQKARK